MTAPPSHESPLYPDQPAMHRLWLSPIGDQQLLGLLMKLVAGLLLPGVVAVSFLRWAARQDAAHRRQRAARRVRTQATGR